MSAKVRLAWLWLDLTDFSLSIQTMFFKCESTEMLFYHTGHPLSVYLLIPGAPGALTSLERRVLGPDPAQGHLLSFPVPAQTWFTRLVEAATPDQFCLFSCCLAPGFHIKDFQAEILENIK